MHTLARGALALALLAHAPLALPLPAQAPRGGLRAERAALLAADARLARDAASIGLAKAVSPQLADDAVWLEDGRDVARGAGAVRRLLAAAPPASQRQRAHAARVDVSADGTHGYSYGFAEAVRPDGAAPDTVAGGHAKYIAYWTKDARGRWRLAAYMRSASAPPGDTAAPAGFASPDADSGHAAPDGAAAAARQVRAADSAFAARADSAGVAEAFAAFAAPDGAVLTGSPVIRYGPAAIGAGFGPPGAVAIQWAPRIARAAPSADLGFTVGEARIESRAADGATRVSYSKYLSVWRRQPGGEWRYVIDGGNARPAPAR